MGTPRLDATRLTRSPTRPCTLSPATRTRRTSRLLRRAQQPDDADEHPAFHAADQRLSKKVENHAGMVSLHFMHYNFARPHMALGNRTTPAMPAGISDHVWTCDEIAA